MVVAHHNLLVGADFSALDAADGNAADIVVVVNGRHQHLQGAFAVLGCGDVLENLVKERF